MHRLPLLLFLLMIAAPVLSADENGFYVDNFGRILEYNGSWFVPRGVNFPYTWFTQNWNSSVSGIAGVGANCVRVVLSNGRRPGWNKTSSRDVQNIIQRCKDNQLIAILEVHDCTGYPEQQGSVPLSTAVNYWKEIKGVLDGQEKYVWINIANEPFDNDQSADVWVNSHKEAITQLRNAGFQHLLVVDAPNWGQDHTNTMPSMANLVLEADNMNRTAMSVHMYHVYSTDNIINSYMKKFANKGWPLLIGEFAADHGDMGDIDERSVMRRAEEYGFGYIGWSWAGNGVGLGSLNITYDFNASSLTPWGNTLVNDENGIRNTAKKAFVYSGIFIEPPTPIEAPVRQHVSPAPVIRETGASVRVAVPVGHILLNVELFDFRGALLTSGTPMKTDNGVAVLDMRLYANGSYLLHCATDRGEFNRLLAVSGR